MFSMNKSKSNMNINKRKNSAALAAKKNNIDFLCIDNSRLNFISTDVSFSRLFMLCYCTGTLCRSASCRNAFCRTCVIRPIRLFVGHNWDRFFNVNMFLNGYLLRKVEWHMTSTPTSTPDTRHRHHNAQNYWSSGEPPLPRYACIYHRYIKE